MEKTLVNVNTCIMLLPMNMLMTKYTCHTEVPNT